MTGCYQGDRLRIWDVATAQALGNPAPRSRDFSTLTVSSDGTRVAASPARPREPEAASPGSCARLRPVSRSSRPKAHPWRTARTAVGWRPWLRITRRCCSWMRTHETAGRLLQRSRKATFLKAAFSPDSRHLATCSGDHRVRPTWEIGNEARVRYWPGHTDEAFAAAFHPGGTRSATGGRDGAVWVVVRPGRGVRRRSSLLGHRSYIWSLASSPDGRHAGVRLRRQHGSPVGPRAFEDAPPGLGEAAALRLEVGKSCFMQLWGENGRRGPRS